MLKSPAIAITCEGPARPLLGSLLVRQARIVAADLRNIPRYVLRAMIGLAVACGLLNLWQSYGDGKIPGMSSLCGLDPYRISSASCLEHETDAESRWKGLAPALAILDQVNPEVAKWLREKHGNGLVMFGDEYRTKGDRMTALAKYDIFRHRLVVYRELFCESDGTIAVTLCHEYRHSRQNLGKFGQYVLSFLFVREGDLSIIENDAEIYEHAAHKAIFGDGRSREKEVAAWQRSVRLLNESSKHDSLSPQPRIADAKATFQWQGGFGCCDIAALAVLLNQTPMKPIGYWNGYEQMRALVNRCLSRPARENVRPAPPPPLPPRPQCGRPLRSVQAQQCVYCGADWHGNKQISSE
jgi:hypothetical protein